MRFAARCLADAIVKVAASVYVTVAMSGMPASDVCASLSSVPAEFWSGHAPMCSDLIERHAVALCGQFGVGLLVVVTVSYAVSKVVASVLLVPVVSLLQGSNARRLPPSHGS